MKSNCCRISLHPLYMTNFVPTAGEDDPSRGWMQRPVRRCWIDVLDLWVNQEFAELHADCNFITALFAVATGTRQRPDVVWSSAPLLVKTNASLQADVRTRWSLNWSHEKQSFPLLCWIMNGRILFETEKKEISLKNQWQLNTNTWDCTHTLKGVAQVIDNNLQN